VPGIEEEKKKAGNCLKNNAFPKDNKIQGANDDPKRISHCRRNPNTFANRCRFRKDMAGEPKRTLRRARSAETDE
jgi:hypothetical protein